MSDAEKTLNELHAMLVSAEKQISKDVKQIPFCLMVQKGKGFKKKGENVKGKGKKVAKTLEKPKPAGESECFYCKKKEHWKRNCRKCLDYLKNNGASTSSNLL
ncbi:uncharacterized protein LOC110697462 [Chenopodium quinoa]|uniref:uncharacterized protein LOC110697462 n=1 Tax=Chenopodium quinoa TaxID=63459 RepID=UPI000B77BC09|nr:uncharacterized protein LOC110697462 [Chenopodium quinoa]